MSFHGERKSHVSHTEQTTYRRAIAYSFLHTIINANSSSLFLGFSKHAIGMPSNISIWPCWRSCTIWCGFWAISRSYLIGHVAAKHRRTEDGVAPHIFWEDIATARRQFLIQQNRAGIRIYRNRALRNSVWDGQLGASRPAEQYWGLLTLLSSEKRSSWVGCSPTTCVVKELAKLCWYVLEWMWWSVMSQAHPHHIHFNAHFTVSRSLCHSHLEVLLQRVPPRHHICVSSPEFTL